MLLFDDCERTYVGFSSNSESTFVFLNRTARPEFQRARDLLEEWFQAYPDQPASAKVDLRNRFRSPDTNNYQGAFFELYCQALLTCHGLTVEVHPLVGQGVTTHPDFLVYRDGSPIFYMECTVYGTSRGEATRDILFNEFLDGLESMDSSNFFIGIEVLQSSVSSPSPNRARRFLQEKLSEIDFDVLSRTVEENGYRAVSPWRWYDSGWEMDFALFPKSADLRDLPDVPVVGTHGFPADWADPNSLLERALKSKATRYGYLNHPYIIAVLSTDMAADFQDLTSTLYGTTVSTMGLTTGKESVFRRKDGFWIRPDGPQRTRVSAVLFIKNLVAWTIASTKPLLLHNAWAEKPVSQSLLEIVQVTYDPFSDSIQQLPGRTSAEVFGLSVNWPRD